MEEDKLDKVIALCENNNKILKGMQRSARTGKFLKIVYWTVIIGSTVSAYYYLQPYIDELMRVYNQINSTASRVGSLPNIDVNNLPPELKSLLNR
ncbi:MAG: hypothetical protein HZA94_00530 [Candidatus Vogelbacteria bacterium]|nr:hypothetical protein [Candidatus Vogelbacteria bacterium]